METKPGDSNVNQESLDYLSSTPAVPLTEHQSTQFITKIEQMTPIDETLVGNDGEGRNVSSITVFSTDFQA